MLVYSDRARRLETGAALADLARRFSGEAADHDQVRQTFLLAASLAQGLAEAEFAERGCDDLTPLQDAAVRLARAAARALIRSWDGQDARPDAAPLRALQALPLPAAVTVKDPEGYAFYALYPEAYAEAARTVDWTAPPLVIGLRSIGLGLAAVVAETTGALDAVSLRPVGPPFRRELRLSAALERRLAAHAGPFALVDEGPGLSGSSFGAVLDRLESLGVAQSRVVVLPSHGGDLGPEASPEHRARWRRLTRRPAAFDLVARRRPVSDLFADLTGAADEVADWSGGGWRDGRLLPAWQQQERLKWRIRTPRGAWMVRFAGLGGFGDAAFDRAQALGGAGLTPAPLALRNGLLLQPWVEGAPLDLARSDDLETWLARYLRFRAEALPAEPGASAAELREMAEVNARELAGPPLAGAVRSALDALPPFEARPVHVDARLHAWEWLRTPDGRILKLDALDHGAAHDLVGGQDIDWDCAGAEVELGLDAERLSRAVQADRFDPARLAFFRLAYPAFQAGLWTFALGGVPAAERPLLAAQVARYRHALETAAGRAGSPAEHGGDHAASA